MTIERIEGINDPRVIPIASEGWAKLVAAGYADSETLLNFQQNAVIARLDDGHVVGVLVYTDQPWKKTIWVDLGYVQPAYRRHGMYRALWNELVQIAQEKQRTRIQAGTHADNEQMQTVMEKLGRFLIFLTYQFDVPEKVDEPAA